MAKTKLSDSNFVLIPEGVTTFKVMDVDDSKYENFGKITVKLQTQKGEVHNETFSLMKSNGETNDGALRAWSYFARTCLGDYQVDEIDTSDIIGCYITATVKHETYTRTKGEHAGEEGTSVRLSDYATADGFPYKAKSGSGGGGDNSGDNSGGDGFMNVPEDDTDLDAFLND